MVTGTVMTPAIPAARVLGVADRHAEPGLVVIVGVSTVGRGDWMWALLRGEGTS